MEGSYTFTCQLCRARLTLVGNLEAAESVAWVGGRGLLVPPHLQASVFDNTNVDESFIVLDGKRQGIPVSGAAALPPHPAPHIQQLQQQQQGPAYALQQQPLPHQQQGLTHLSPRLQQPQQQGGLPHHVSQQQPQPQHPARGLEESFVVLGAASVLRPTPAYPHMYPPPGVSPLHLQAMQQLQPQHQQHQQHQQQSQQASGPGQAMTPTSARHQQDQQALQPSGPQQQMVGQHQQTGPAQPSPSQTPAAASPSSQTYVSQAQQPSAFAAQNPHPNISPPQPYHVRCGSGASTTAVGGGAGLQQGGPEVESGYSSPAGPGGRGGGSNGGGSNGGPVGSGLDFKLQALAQLFELASTNTQVDHPLCMDCVGQLKEEMEAQIAEAEREIAAYSVCLAQLESDNLGGGLGGVSEPAAVRDAEEYRLEEISRLEQERDQERARAEVLESELAAVVSELSSLSAAAADLDSLEERYWNDVNDFELLLRAHTDERGALLAKIDRTGQRLQLLKNTSVLYDAFKIWHDGPFGTISGFRLGRTPEVPVEWDEINAAWGQAVLLLHTMAQMCKVQFSSHRLLPMGSHPRVADKRATYDLFGPVSKLWSANYDRAMVAYLACLREFGEHARKKDLQDGKPTQFNFPFAIDGDKVNNHTVKLTLNKDVRWTKALKFMLANLKIALQWCVKQDQKIEVPQLQQLQQEGPQLMPEH
ncbi:hypothetical protein VaNZ11_003559 [Volvox africanus]|uniref:Uncharacterized protein n=1 Tax=Volvox africanus TaxID=51714 RepID=A0ABQ5RW12_9CHLO|nr:hypothetical protein VaNZ11_003559 [Volvox africanus]